MVALPVDWGSVRGIVIGGLVLLAGTVTVTLSNDNGLAALVAAVVLLILLLLDDRYTPDNEE
jgi:dipeptide/tripeptide permease